MKISPLIGSVLLAASASATAQVTLNANSWTPQTHPLTTTLASWCADVEKATSARVKCNLLPKPVVAAGQTFDAVKDGLADVSFIVHGFTPGRFPLAEITEFPFLGDTAEHTSVAYQRIYERLLAKADEHKGVVTLAVHTHGPGQIFNTKRPIVGAKDLQGLKMRVPGGMVNETSKAMGVTPILKPPAEIYEMLSSGLADGVFFPKEAVFTFKVIPLLKHATYVPGGLYNVSIAYVMNPAAWNKISKADQAEVMKLSGESLARRGAKAYDEGDVKGEAAVREAKVRVDVATPELIAEIKAKSADLERAWIERAKAKGVDGAAALAALRAEIATLSKK
jgi:TRAP-type C4-dicarboxylate transport system substrate-binding protein